MHTRRDFNKRVVAGLTTAAFAGFAPRHLLAAATGADPQKYQQLVQKAVDFLKGSQAADGAFSPSGVGPGITSIVLTGVLRCGRGVDDPVVAKGMKYMEGFVQPDGGIYDKSARQKNYEAAVAQVCFKEANRDGRYDAVVKNCDKYLKGLQFPASDARPQSDLSYGGVGYAGPERPDLSNTQYLMDALQAAGNGPQDDAVKKALVFISRCQNLETEHNTSKYPALNPDGGFYYAPRDDGSKAGKTDNGGLRSYGSMTYAGLKSMIFAGLTADDPRVKAATKWIKDNYTVTENPGIGPQGQYYYYALFGKALDALGQDQFVDSKGTSHDWRGELVDQLAKLQKENGSWVNSNTTWMEGDPNLVTGYTLQALSYCNPTAKK